MSAAQGNATVPCPLCDVFVDCAVLVDASDDPTGWALIRLNLHLDERPLRAHVAYAHSVGFGVVDPATGRLNRD